MAKQKLYIHIRAVTLDNPGLEDVNDVTAKFVNELSRNVQNITSVSVTTEDIESKK